MTGRTRAAGAIVGIALVVAGTAWLLERRRADGSSGSGQENARGADAARASDAPFRFSWPRGHRDVYAVASRTRVSSEVPVPGGAPEPLTADVDLALRVVLTSFGLQGDGFLLRVELEEPTRSTMRIDDKSVFADAAAARAALVGHAAYATIDARGEVRALHYVPSDPSTFKDLVRSMVLLMQTTLPEVKQDMWLATETAPAGRRESRYRADSRDPLRLLREPVRYTSFDAFPSASLVGRPEAHDVRGGAAIALDRAGQLVSTHATEDLKVTRDGRPVLVWSEAFEAKREAVEQVDPGPPVDLAALETVKPSQGGSNPLADRQLLEQRARGMTAEKLMHDVDRFAHAGAVGDPRRWFLQASAFLALHPETCEALAVAYASAGMTDPGRQTILNVLATAGTDAAQGAMRKALATGPAAGKGYASLLQNLSLLEKPSPETAQLVARTYDSARARGDREVTFGAAYVLGSMVDGLTKRGDLGEASRYHGELVDGLRAAKTPNERHAYLAALGNAHDRDDGSIVASYANDESVSVRREVAVALRAIDAPDARTALVGLTSDKDESVAASAYASLVDQPMTDADFSALAASVLAGKTPAGADAALVTLIAHHHENADLAAQVLRFLAARDTADAQLEAKIGATLDALARAK